MIGRSTRQAFDWLLDPKIRSVAITGICKNAGKTTLLNHLLALDPVLPQGVFSTGIDGEETDTVFRNPKPRVKLPAGCVFCCDTATLDKQASSVSVLGKLPLSDHLRQLWLARAEENLQTEITGPATVGEQTKTLEMMLAQGFSRVFIDGSLDRKSISLSEAVDAVVLLLGASFGSPSSVQMELQRLLTLNSIPVTDLLDIDINNRIELLTRSCISYSLAGKWHATAFDSLIGSEKQLSRILAQKPDKLYVPGAMTDPMLSRLKGMLSEHPLQIVFRHPDCIKLSLAKLDSFLVQFGVRVLIEFKIRTFVLNSQAIGTPAVDADLFRSRLRNEFPDLDLPDIRELVQ